MTNSRSRASISKRWLVLVLLVFGLGGLAYADKRKRVVVLPFEGEKAEKFHEAVVKLLKKTHTVISTAKWEGTAEELSAAKVTGKNIKKVAKKLKIDGIVEGTVEKRRDEYIIRIKLHAGTTGEIVGSPINTKADGPRLDGSAAKDLKDELIDAISALDSNRAGGGDDDEEDAKPTKTKKPPKGSAGDDDEEDAKPTKTKKPPKGSASNDDEEDAKPTKTKKPAKGDDDEEDVKPKKGFSKGVEMKGGDKVKKPGKTTDDDEGAALKPKKSGDDEEDNPLPKAKKRPGKAKDADGDGDEVATKSKGDDGDEIEEKAAGPKMDRARALSPGNRAIDGVVGVSFNARRLSWKTSADLPPSMGVAGTGKPPNYKGVPAPGLLLDLTAYPLAFGHKSEGMLKNLGLNVMYDKVLLISSKAGGQKLTTAEQRFGVGAVFRYPFNKTAMSPVVGAGLGFGNQKFQIAGGADIPNVNYTFINPSLFFHYPISEKLVLNLDFSYLLVSKTGQMQRPDQYGGAKVSGIEGEIGGDYALTKTLFARAAIKFETIGFKFNGSGMLTTGRDGDTDVDVSGARDTYLGGAVTVGYLY